MMMMKQQQQQQQQQQQSFLEENVSNLTCASADTSVSNSSVFPPPKKKRSLPGNPDPDSEVIALSPKSLMATNRFVCEVCNKGFQRDQNLQLHRRGHNLPWKLKLKSSKEMKKKVYVCPEVGCVHHDPSRALGDLTGIKKHFCRKHGEKKWKCEKCSKRYAVQSDWKAHSKTCGTREYRCDCGTPFSRRDSFITHRAFCDILAEANAKSITDNAIFLKKEEQQERSEIPPWLACNILMEENQNQNPRNGGVGPIDHETNSEAAHMSATALLQKAAQMSANMNKNYSLSSLLGAHQGVHMSGFGLNLSSCDHQEMGMMNQNLYIPSSSSCGGLFQEMMNSSSVSGNGFDGGSSIEDAFNGILGSNNHYHHHHHNHHDDINGDDHSMTRDFLGLSQADVFTINAGLGQNQTSWQG